MLAHGHPEAASYPLGLLHDEVLLVENRLNQDYATQAVLLQMAISSVLSTEAGKEFQKVVARLIQG